MNLSALMGLYPSDVFVFNLYPWIFSLLTAHGPHDVQLTYGSHFTLAPYLSIPHIPSSHLRPQSGLYLLAVGLVVHIVACNVNTCARIMSRREKHGVSVS